MRHDGRVRAALLAWIGLAAMAGAWGGWHGGFLSTPRGAWFFFLIALLAGTGGASAAKGSNDPADPLIAAASAI